MSLSIKWNKQSMGSEATVSFVSSVVLGIQFFSKCSFLHPNMRHSGPGLSKGCTISKLDIIKVEPHQIHRQTMRQFTCLICLLCVCVCGGVRFTSCQPAFVCSSLFLLICVIVRAQNFPAASSLSSWGSVTTQNMPDSPSLLIYLKSTMA